MMDAQIVAGMADELASAVAWSFVAGLATAYLPGLALRLIERWQGAD